MKPRELYSGTAPAAQAQMGAGILEAGANIGRSIQSGYQALGQGLASGITSAAGSIAGAYVDYKKMQSQVKADANAFQTLRSYMPKDVVESFDMQERAMNTDPNTSLADKHAFYGSLKGFLGQSVQQKMDMDKLGEQLKVQKGLGLSNIIAPYVMGTKAGMVDPSQFFAPGFDQPSTQTQSQAASPITQPMPPQGGGSISMDEAKAFQQAYPNGTWEDYNAWSKQRLNARKQEAEANPQQIDFGILGLPR
jgi:hypothetical protein